MTIYSDKNYRRIYEQHFGSIPKDSEGRKFEIHHIDGNHKNNSPSNLTAVTVEEHYAIHYQRGDWAACLLMSDRMKISPEEKTKISRKNCADQLKNGTHPLMKRTDGTSQASDAVKNGTHNFMTRADGTSYSSDRALRGENPLAKRKDGTSVSSDRVAKGTHSWLRRADGTSIGSDQVKAGTHVFLRRPDGSSVASDHAKRGKDHHMFDHTLYKFENVKTGEVIEITQHEFGVRFGKGNVWSMIKDQTQCRVRYGWRIIRD